MAKIPTERSNEINIEDLLRLKRSERPSDEFWNDFDRELHQRMLQTLVKKDPWYLQVLRGFSSRMVQSTAVAAAAVLVAMVVVRPAFQPALSPEVSMAMMITPEVEPLVNAPMDVVAPAKVSIAPAAVATVPSRTDYHADVISAEGSSSDVNFVRDFGMESMQVASYDAAAYSTESAHARASFTSAGVASLVY